MATTKGARGRQGQQGKAGPRGPAGLRGPAGAPPNVDEVDARLDRIQELADVLAKCHRDVLDQMDLSTRLHREIQAAKLALKPSVSK